MKEVSASAVMFTQEEKLNSFLSKTLLLNSEL